MTKKKYSKQISLGYDSEGKRIRKRIYANSPSELNSIEKKAVETYTRLGNPSNIKLKTYIDRWFDAYCTNLSLNTKKGYKTALRKLEPLYYYPMSKITRTDLQKIVNENWGHTYLCRRLCILINAVWNSAIIDGVIVRNASQGLKRPKVNKKEKRAFTPQELKAIKEAQFEPLEQLMVNILLQFGLRPGEAFALDRTSIDRENLVLTVNKSLTHDGEKPVIKDTKTSVTRYLPIPREFLPKLTPVNNTLYLFTNSNGTLFTKKQCHYFGQKILGKINKQMGGTKHLKVTDIVLYSFRHNRASVLMYTDSISLLAKAKYMGHSPEVFMRTYAHIIEEKEDFEKLKEEVI